MSLSYEERSALNGIGIVVRAELEGEVRCTHNGRRVIYSESDLRRMVRPNLFRRLRQKISRGVA